MKKFLLYLVLSYSLVIFLTSFNYNDGKYSDGSPAGYTDSPHDGKDCSVSGCHSSTSALVSNYITTNIPSQGYTPGASYQITITVPGTNGDAKGFEVSPQDSAGTILGSLTAGTGSKLTAGNTGYITQSSAVSGSPAVWVFDWTAPAAGTGQVTFYGAFISGFSNCSHSITVVQEFHIGINDLKTQLGFSAYPNPVQNSLTLSYTLTQQEHVNLSLFDETGKMILPLINEIQNEGKFTRSFDLKGTVRPGLYFLTINKNGSDKILDKIIVN
ncbi:MAG: choice-of-anchor V domain-containing protein [Bacteroidales bacterium]|jgi:hypothetical protein